VVAQLLGPPAGVGAGDGAVAPPKLSRRKLLGNFMLQTFSDKNSIFRPLFDNNRYERQF